MNRLQNLILPVLLLTCSISLFGQGATIQGEVRDVSTAKVPKAQLTVTNKKTGVALPATANDIGFYSVSSLIPGDYSVQAKADGFESVVASLTLEVNQTARVDFSLKPGATSQTIDVQASSTALNTDTSVVGQVINNKTVVDLPLNGRNYLQLAQLTAGVTPASGSRNSSLGSFSALGQQVYQTNILLDGLDNSTRASGGELGYQAQAVTPSIDAVDQFEVVTNNNSAEYGVHMGATVLLQTKSGTNQFHGSLYEFLRNGDLDATSFFSVGQAKPPYHQHQFGGTVGGPIVKNKLFAFGSVEATRIDAGSTSITTVPTAAERAGNFTGRAPIFDPATTTALSNGTDTRTVFPGNQIPASRFDPVAAKVIALYPLPNLPGNTSNYYFSSPLTNNTNEYDDRVDYNLNSSDRFFVRYSRRDSNQLQPGSLPLPADGGLWETVGLTSNSYAGSWNLVLSPSTTNELRLGYSRFNTLIGVPSEPNYNAQLGIQGIPAGLGAANNTGLTLFTATNYAQVGTQNFWPNTNNLGIIQVSDMLAKVVATHTMKFGFQFLREYNFRNAARYARGNISFNGSFSQDPNNRGVTGDAMADFLLGEASGGTIGNQNGESMLTHNYSGFFQDDWRITPRLTLNLGIRWDRFGPPSFHNIYAALFEFQPGTQNYQVVLPKNQSDCGCAQNNTNFAPRVGFAFQATPKTVIRSGFGLYFGEPSYENEDGARFFNQPPSFTEISFPTDKLFSPALIVSQGFPAGLLPATAIRQNSSVSTAQQSKPNQYTIQYFFDVQRQLPGQVLLTAAYLGEGFRQLPYSININTPFTPGPGTLQNRRPYPFFGTISQYPAGAIGSYNALTLKAEKRYSNGLVFLTSYTWSHDIGEGSGLLNDNSGAVRDPYNLALDYGNEPYDRRQTLTSSFAYDLPFGVGRRWLNSGGPVTWLLGGWQLGGILTLQTGQYFTPTLSVDLANMGTTNFPNAIGNPNVLSGSRTIQDWFNTAAFALPAQYTFGNAGRGIVEGPPLHNMDIKIGKSFVIRERFRLDFRAEMFNFTNTPHFALPNATVNSPQEGKITSTLGNPRLIQLALKLVF